MKKILTVLIATLSLFGCATKMSMTDSAVDSNWEGDSPQKVMIVGLAERRYRTPFESAFVDELRSRGFEAVTSAAYAPVLSDLEDESKINDILAQSGADSLMTVQAVDVREANNDAWAVAYIAGALFADNYQESRGMRALVAAGALADNASAANYGIEIQFFDTKTDRMIWTGKTKTFDAGDLDDLVILLADVIVDDLSAKGVL